jgi:hypothetical protein
LLRTELKCLYSIIVSRESILSRIYTKNGFIVNTIKSFTHFLLVAFIKGEPGSSVSIVSGWTTGRSRFDPR